jgi:hypothetical protein
MPRKFGKSRQNQTDSPPLLFTMGELDLIFRIDFKEEDLEIKSDEDNKNKGNSIHKKYYKLRNLYEISSLSFLHKNNDVIK